MPKGHLSKRFGVVGCGLGLVALRDLFLPPCDCWFCFARALVSLGLLVTQAWLLLSSRLMVDLALVLVCWAAWTVVLFGLWGCFGLRVHCSLLGC